LRFRFCFLFRFVFFFTFAGLCGIEENEEHLLSLDAQLTTGVVRAFEERAAKIEAKNENNLQTLIQNELLTSEYQISENVRQQNLIKELERAKQLNTCEDATHIKPQETSYHNDKTLMSTFSKLQQNQNISELEKWLQDYDAQDEEEEKRKEDETKKREEERRENEVIDNFVAEFNKELNRLNDVISKTHSLVKSHQKSLDSTLRDFETWKKTFVSSMNSKRQDITSILETFSTEIDSVMHCLPTQYNKYSLNLEQFSKSQSQSQAQADNIFSGQQSHNDKKNLCLSSTLSPNEFNVHANSLESRHTTAQIDTDTDEEYFSFSEDDNASCNSFRDKNMNEIDQIFKEMDSTLSNIEHIVHQPIHLEINTTDTPKNCSTKNQPNNNNNKENINRDKNRITNNNERTEVVANREDNSKTRKTFVFDLFQSNGKLTQ
jgi:hypothetical protein